MKKIIALILTLCLLSMSGCGTSSDVSDNSVSSTVSVELSTATDESVEESPSEISDNSDVSENAEVSDDSVVSENTEISDSSNVSGNGDVSDISKASGNSGSSDTSKSSGNGGDTSKASGSSGSDTSKSSGNGSDTSKSSGNGGDTSKSSGKGDESTPSDESKPSTPPSTGGQKEEPLVDTVTPLEMKDYYGYGQLAKKGGKLLTAYLRMVEVAEKMDTADVSLSDLGLTVDEAKLVYMYYRADFPQHFWIENQYGWSTSGGKLMYFKLTYSMTKSERDTAQKKVRSAAKQILSGITEKMDTYQREKYIHDELVRLTEYDITFSKPHTHDLYGALVNNSAVCEGYARAFQYLMYQAGIPCLFVTGTGTNSSGNSESHAWNIVQIDGAYYLVDVTWDDPISFSSDKPIYYAYFNCTTEQFNRDHKAGDDNYPLPNCTATKANYFVREGTVVDKFDADQVASFIKANKSIGEVHLYVKGSLSEYLEALSKSNDLFQKAGISSLQMMYIGQELVLRFS